MIKSALLAMSQPEILHFNPPPRPHDPGNNPLGASVAREKIANLADHYGKKPDAPSKEELASQLKPVSPAAEGVSLASELPAVSDFVLRNSSAITSAIPRSRPISLPGRIKPLIVGLVTFFLLFAVFKSPILLSQLGYATQKTPPVPASAVAANTVGPEPLLTIPKVNVNAPIVYAQSNVEAAIQKDLEGGVVHYAGTALPGQPGNNVIFGHSSNDWWEPGNYKFVFVLLDKLVPGDTMTLNYQSKQYLYQVTSSEVVEPTNVGVLAPTTEPTLTLITCTPPGTSWKRLIIHAKQLSPTTATAQSAKTNPVAPPGVLPSNSPDFMTQISNFWKNLTHTFGGGSNSTPTTLPASK